MRFTEFRIIKEATENIAVIGDSIAVGIQSAGGVSAGKSVGGSSPQQVLGFVQTFVQSGKAKGATVILSSGASNGTYERPNGEKQTLNMGPIDQQLKLLKDAGASVALVGTGSAKSKTFTNQYGTYFVNFESEKVNEKLAASATAHGAKFLGPLEDFDPGLNSGRGDGIHPYGGYSKLFKAGSAVATPDAPKTKDTAGQGASPTAVTLDVPSSRGPAVRDVQQALIALGYNLPKHGADGIRGPETVAAVKEFQQDNNLAVDGDPGPETVGMLNKLIISKGIKVTK